MHIYTLIQNSVREAVKRIYKLEAEEVFVEHPSNESWGDYATNIAIRIAASVKQSPQEIARKLCYELRYADLHFDFQGQELPIFDNVDSAPGGFINFKLSKEWLYSVLYTVVEQAGSYGTSDSEGQNPYFGRNLLVEYTDSNPFKLFHIGHLMSNCIGESLSRLLEFVGGKVKRANYQGDVGMHVAKSIWGVQKKLVEEKVTLVDLAAKSLEDRIAFLGQAYALGATAYKENATAAEEIKNLNYLVFVSAQEHLAESAHWTPQVDYKKYVEDDTLLAEVRELYDKGRVWSLEYFETVYKRLGTKFDFYYFESLVGEIGYTVVKEFLNKGVFEESDGAVVFRGEKYGLHTRVFINALGLPTYEAKELGLAHRKYDDYNYDISLVVTANEISEYFKVLLKAMEFVYPDLAAKTKHVPHGMMRLATGKMSSRTGDVVSGAALIEEVASFVLEQMEEGKFSGEEEKKLVADKIAVGALKYDVLKHTVGRDIVFDRERALALVGSTGPYLQYTYVRARSVLEKGDFVLPESPVLQKLSLDEQEETLLRSIYKFSEIVEKAALEFAPNVLCDYLFDLAQRFNAFYAAVPILGAAEEEQKQFRMLLTSSVAQIVKNGLYLLGIDVVEKM